MQLRSVLTLPRFTAVAVAVAALSATGASGATRRGVSLEIVWAHGAHTIVATTATSPILHARLTVHGRGIAAEVGIESNAPGKAPTLLGLARTSKQGLLTLRLPPSPTRYIRVVYATLTSNVILQRSVAAPNPVALRLQWAGRTTTITALSTQSPVLHGRVTLRGHGIAAIVTVESNAPGQPPTPLWHVPASTSGHFTLQLPPSAAIRYIRAVYSSATSNVLLQQPGVAITLTARPRSVRPGQPLHLNGTVAVIGNFIVALQVRQGSNWRTFQTVRTHTSGAFFDTWVFALGNASYDLRALLLEQNGEPYADSPSNTVRVKVR